jgi:DNA topoisomerase-1
VLHETHLRDRRLAKIVRQVQELPGQRLFKYVDADGQLHDVESADVNAYLREALEGDFTAKDFRTWAGTVSAARALLEEPVPESATAAKKALARCVKGVARRLGNTPAVCRSSYIHPKVLDSFAAGALGEAFVEADTTDAFEAACLAFLAAEASVAQEKTGEA